MAYHRGDNSEGMPPSKSWWRMDVTPPSMEMFQNTPTLAEHYYAIQGDLPSGYDTNNPTPEPLPVPEPPPLAAAPEPDLTTPGPALGEPQSARDLEIPAAPTLNLVDEFPDDGPSAEGLTPKTPPPVVPGGRIVPRERHRDTLPEPEKPRSDIRGPRPTPDIPGRLNLDDAVPVDVPGVNYSPEGDIGRESQDVLGAIQDYHDQLVQLLRQLRARINSNRADIETLIGWFHRNL